MALIDTLKTHAKQSLIKAFPSAKDHELIITAATVKKFGHYQINSAMALAKILRQKPQDIASTWLDAMDISQDPMIQNAEIKGPGFINITLSNDFLSQGVIHILENPSLEFMKEKNRQKIVIDYSSPNIAKEMHVGHLRSTIIGDALARTLRFLGHEVCALNHIGDWGTSFGMLIAFLREQHPEVIGPDSKATLSQLAAWYKEARALFEQDAAFKKRAQLAVVALQSGDIQALDAWKMICDISKKAYQHIYSLLDVKIEDRGESFYNPWLDQTIKDLKSRGIAVESDGAWCIFANDSKNRQGEPMPFLIQKSDGGYNYASTDITALKHRIEEEKADRIIYVVDAGQSGHFQLLFSSAKEAGYLEKSPVELEFVPFGLVLGEDGKKYKTRSGENEKLIDLLETAISKSKALLNERKVDWSQGEIDQSAKVLGIGAVKYADLSCNRIGDYTFSYERMLRFEGNTAAFILYAYVRIQSILKKSNQTANITACSTLSHQSEIDLMLKINQFAETIDKVAKDLMPNRLCDYLYQLAECFNGFFRDCPVIGDPQEAARIALAQATAIILAQGLSLLGIETLTRM